MSGNLLTQTKIIEHKCKSHFIKRAKTNAGFASAVSSRTLLAVLRRPEVAYIEGVEVGGKALDCAGA